MATGNILVTSINIENWRGIKRLKEPLRLKKFNILVGRNNTGKTSILEALALLPHPQLKRPYLKKIEEIKPTIEDYLAKTHWSKRSLMYKYANNASIDYTLGYRLPTIIKAIFDSKWNVELHVGGNQYKITVSVTRGVLEQPLVIADSNVKASDIIQDVIVLFVPSDTLFYRGIVEFFDDVDVWSIVEARGIHKRVVEELVNPVVDDVFTELHLGRRGVEIRREDGTWIHVKDLGSGIQRVIVMALLVEYVNPRLVAIDDVEVAMHPGLLKYFLKWLYDKGVQVVLSTHSRDVIEVFNELELGPDEAHVIVLFKGRDDVVKARYIYPDELSEMIEHGVDLRKALNLLEPSM